MFIRFRSLDGLFLCALIGRIIFLVDSLVSRLSSDTVGAAKAISGIITSGGWLIDETLPKPYTS